MLSQRNTLNRNGNRSVPRLACLRGQVATKAYLE
jgi:hypothetical protein